MTNDDKLVGEGTYASVYTRDREGSKVAVKKFCLPDCNLQEIKKEVDILARLYHKNITRYYDVEQKGDHLHIIMEYADGGTLEKAVPKLDWEDKKRIVAEIAEGLAYLHSEGIIHRDIKHTNILLTAQNTVKLCDFGCAKLLAATLSASTCSPRGTRGWIAPELNCARPKYSEKSDIYALGVVMEKMSIPGKTPLDYRTLMEECLVKNPMERPSAEKIAHAFSITKREGINRRQELPSRPSLNEQVHSLDQDPLAHRQELFNSVELDDDDALIIRGLSIFRDDQDPDVHKNAFELLRVALGQGNPDAQHDLRTLQRDFDEKYPLNQQTAMARIMNAVNQEHPQVQYALGLVYQKGIGVQQDQFKATQWIQKAADMGYSRAQYTLGLTYYNGTGVQQDHVKAAEWVRKAADSGCSGAKNIMGHIYRNSVEVVSHTSIAKEWWRVAAMEGDIDAQYALGFLHYDGKEVLQDYAEASKWFLRSAHQGHVYSQFYMYRMYMAGDGVPQDATKAVEWLQMAANQGYMDAKLILALRNKDKTSVFECLQIQAQQGHSNAQYHLWRAYWFGEGTPRDCIKAIDWLKRSSAQGFEPAEYDLGIMYYNGEGVQQDHNEAQKWLEKASNQGNVNAAFLLYRIYKGLANPASSPSNVIPTEEVRYL
ncbi:hypothetical protein BGZ83_009528 [Gryganskiella cystojenkinii]|nr:hypothetical protein BGZ83_009528 [Gryganskiella cystojenkinii]